SSKKGHKLTKAQRARQQQEEEERKLREEEARLQAERQEQERLRREQKEREVRRLELKDEERRDGELEELRLLLQENQEKWERYMRCDGTPDPTERRHVNTYISMWRDDPEVNITQVLQQCSCALLTEELEVLLEEVSDPEEEEKLQESFVNLQEIIHLKLNLAAEEILKAANKNIDPETENMQTEIMDDNVTLCLWANLRKRIFKGFHFEKAGLSFELPKCLAVKDIAIGILHTRYDHLSMGSDDVVDLLKYSPLGGVFYYGVFHLPPQVHLLSHWEVREIVDSGLKAFPYTAETSSSDDSEAPSDPHVGVSVTLPDWARFLKTPKVALWDAATRWVGGVMDLTYQEAETKVSFRMPSFRPFVLMQETYANLPFQSWELRPLSDNSALFSISGALLHLSITENLCMLQSDQRKGLAHILGRWMSRAALQRAMTKAGLHIFVNEHTHRYVHTCRKNPTTEHAAYQQMALLASACAFSWSKWNTQCGDEHLVMQVCEHLPPTAVPAGRWSLYLLGPQRVQRLEATEDSEAFSLDHHPDSEFHSTLVHMLRDTMSPDGAARTRESGYRFVEAVQSLL
uniref:Dynein axonemal intermediate chain 7 n=1 Tax=Oryzias latipes TaxID=8090 RepID=A0A3P9LV89_ORYLA